MSDANQVLRVAPSLLSDAHLGRTTGSAPRRPGLEAEHAIDRLNTQARAVAPSNWEFVSVLMFRRRTTTFLELCTARN